MYNKTKFFISFSILVLLAISCSETSTDKKQKTTDEVTKSQLKVDINGEGDKTQVIMLNKGAAIFSITHNGSRNFIVWLKSKDADNMDLLVNDIGRYNGSKSVKIPEDGTYIIDVQADGKWLIYIR